MAGFAHLNVVPAGDHVVDGIFTEGIGLALAVEFFTVVNPDQCTTQRPVTAGDDAGYPCRGATVLAGL